MSGRRIWSHTMKVPLLIFLCLVLILGSNCASDAASISKRAEGKSTPSENGSDAASLTIDDVASVMNFVFRTLGQIGPIRLICEAIGLPLNMLLSPILDVLGAILMPVRQLLSKSLSSLAPALKDILLQLARFLDELLDNLANALDPISSSSSSSSSLSTSLFTSSNLLPVSSVSSNVYRRRRKSLRYILPLAMANLLRVSTGSTTSASNGNDLVSTFSNLLSCDTSTSDKLPSANEIRTDPAKSLNVFICFTVNRIMNVGEGVIERVIPSLIESLKDINETGIIPPPFSIWIRTLIILYEMASALRNSG